MTKLETLQKKKIDLLDKYLIEASELIKKYHWRVDHIVDMIVLDKLSDELDKITKEIEDAS